MALGWFRWWTGACQDPKFRTVAKRSGAALTEVLSIWAWVLEEASQADGSLEKLDAETLSITYGMDEEAVAAVLAAMEAKGLIEDGAVANWRKRQPLREDDQKARRTREWRERQRAKAEAQEPEPEAEPLLEEMHRDAVRRIEAQVKCNEAQGAAPDSDSDSDSDSERKSRGRKTESCQNGRRKTATLTRLSPTTETLLLDAVQVFNERASRSGWPQAQRLTEPRKAALRKRLDECGGLSGWTEAMERAGKSTFLCGGGERGWTASLDFFLQAKSFTKLMEGAYDERTGTGNDTRISDKFRRTVEAVSERVGGFGNAGGDDLWPDYDGPRRNHH